jgi:hypothetical protein
MNRKIWNESRGINDIKIWNESKGINDIKNNDTNINR